MGSCWYMCRREIEENSPSRKDGIDTNTENQMRRSYAAFIKDLGITLNLPPIATATAVVFCQRFFLRQSLAKNDPWTIATVCMFLASKVKETGCRLRNVIKVSYQMIHEKDPAAPQRITQKEVYQQQRELILLGERLVLITLGFDLNVPHPYGILNEAVERINVANNELGQAAWDFINDGLSTSLWLQFKPKHIAAGAIYMASKLLRVKLRTVDDKPWWRWIGVTSRILEEFSNQMLDLYKEAGVAPSRRGRVPELALAGRMRAATKSPAANEKQASKPISFQPVP